jgi:hypothetical protein
MAIGLFGWFCPEQCRPHHSGELNLTRIIIFITQPKEESMSQVYRDLLKRQKLQASIGASARSSPGQPATN